MPAAWQICERLDSAGPLLASPSDLAAEEQVGEGAIMETKLRIPRFSPRPSPSFLPSFLSPLNDDDERPRNRPIPSAGITAETTRFSRVLSGFRDYTSK